MPMILNIPSKWQISTLRVIGQYLAVLFFKYEIALFNFTSKKRSLTVKYLLQSSGGCRSASGAVGAVTVASAGAGAGACAARMASAGAQYRGGQQWAAAYAPQPCRYPPPQPQPYAAAPSPYTPHQVRHKYNKFQYLPSWIWFAIDNCEFSLNVTFLGRYGGKKTSSRTRSDLFVTETRN